MTHQCKHIINETANQKKEEGIEGVIITTAHASDDMHNCVKRANYSTLTKHICQPGWFIKDLLEEFFPELIHNENIMHYTNPNPVKEYYAANFAITFECKEDAKCGNAIDYTNFLPSGIWCSGKGKTNTSGKGYPYNELSADNNNKSACYHSKDFNKNALHNKNFFWNTTCPNLVLDCSVEELKECAGKTIVAKLVSPLIIVDKSNMIIDKDGNNTKIPYLHLEHFLTFDGKLKDDPKNNCAIYKNLTKKPTELIELKDKVLWTSDKEVKLIIPDTGNMRCLGSPSKSESVIQKSDEITTDNEELPSYNYSNDYVL